MSAISLSFMLKLKVIFFRMLKKIKGAARDVAAVPQTPNWGGGPRPTLGAQVSLKLLFGYVTIFSSADVFTTDLNCRKKLACDIISECLRHFISQNLEYFD